MYLFLILFCFSLVLFFVLTVIFDNHFQLFPLYFFVPMFISILVSLFVIPGVETVETVFSEDNIYSLQDNITVEGKGAFTLYRSTENNKYFYYVYDKENDCLKYGSCSADDVVLKFDNNARLVEYITQTKNEKLRSWFWDLNAKRYKVLYVPKECVIATVDVNLQ